MYEYGEGTFYGEYGDDKNCKSSEDTGSHCEEYSSGEDGISDSKAEELYIQDTNIIVLVSVLEGLIYSSMVYKYRHESVSLIEEQQYSTGLE